MSKKKYREATCVYCGSFGKCTEEHVIPECLFAEGFRPTKGSEFVKLPCCGKCNGRKSADDSYMRDVLISFPETENSPAAQALIPALARSAASGNSTLAKHARTGWRLEPHFNHQGLYVGHHATAPLHWNRVQRFFRWVTQGLYFRVFNERLPEDCKFEVFKLDPLDAEQSFYRMRQMGANGPNFIGNGVFGCVFLFGKEDPHVSEWLFNFLDSVTFSVTTVPAKYEGRDGKWLAPPIVLDEAPRTNHLDLGSSRGT